MQFRKIAEDIIALKEKDIALRNKLIQNKELGQGYNEEMAQLHNSNATALNEIINAIGYPTTDKVGEEANKAAWLIIQHSIGQPSFMKKCLKVLEDIELKNETISRQFAYLTDRIAVHEGNPQQFGTQFDWNKNGELSPNPFDDLSKVNQRRKTIGLNSIEEQTKLIRRQAAMENQLPPVDFMKRKKEMEAWRKSVGWLE